MNLPAKQSIPGLGVCHLNKEAEIFHELPRNQLMGLGVWPAEGVEAKSGPSEDSFCRFRRRISRYLARKRRKIDRCGHFAADASSAAQTPSFKSVSSLSTPGFFWQQRHRHLHESRCCRSTD